MNPDTILCISDLHLSDARPDLLSGFERFVAGPARDAQALYILGDLFDAWIGDDDNSGCAARVSRSLSALADANIAVYLMHGNRDFLLGESYARRCGATLIQEPHHLAQGGHHYLLLHGDSLCTRDTDYMAFRRMVRNPDWQREFLSRSLAERRAFAEQARAQSLSMGSNKPLDIMDVTPGEVEKCLLAAQETVLIHGHTHRPAVHDIQVGGKEGKRIVLGDWETTGWCLSLDAAGYRLAEFPL